jgi:hypothetical protein
MLPVQRLLAYASVWLVFAALVPQAVLDVAQAQAAEVADTERRGEDPSQHPEVSPTDCIKLVASLDRSTGWVALASHVEVSARYVTWSHAAQARFASWTPDRRSGIRHARGGLHLPSSDDADAAAH